MPLLKDTQILQLLAAANPIVTGLPATWDTVPLPAAPPVAGADLDPWYSKSSPVQASSLDLHVGNILLPGVKRDELGGVDNAEDHFELAIGNTVVITTQETLHMPDDLAAIGFPHARLSFRGLLMTNIGHVDPGFVGPLRFAVMNIGKATIQLRRGDPIVTMLFDRLTAAAGAGWARRSGALLATGPTHDQVNYLSKDFLDVTSRAETAAAKAVEKADLASKIWGVRIPILVFIATILTTLVGGCIGLWQPLQLIKTDVENVNKVLKLEAAKSRLDELEKLQKQNDDVVKRLDDLIKKIESKAGPKGGGGNP